MMILSNYVILNMSAFRIKSFASIFGGNISLRSSYSTFTGGRSSSFRPSSVNAVGGAASAMLAVKDQPQVVMRHFAKILTKHGIRGEDVLSRVSMTLRHKYGHRCPIQVAVDAIKPVLKYQKFKNARSFVPVVLYPKPSYGIAIRWIVELAGRRTYVGDRPNLERGLTDELDAIIQGTSSLYAKRLQYHKNPN